MKRCFITGIAGFLGSHLAEFLLAQGMAVYGTLHRDSKNIQHIKDKLTLLPCDILDRGQVEAAVREARPDLLFHLAAESHPLSSWQDADSSLRVNVFGTLHLLEAVGKAGLSPAIVVACSSAEYGFVNEDEIPIKETSELRPASPYGVSKVAADLLSRLYWQAYGMKVVRVRPFFVTGPRKVGDVCSDLARGVVAVERGQSDRLRVGNLSAVRDFIDVRDAVAALWLLAEKGLPGEVYNVCSSAGHRVQEVLDILVSMADRPVPVEQDQQLMRPADEPVVIGDNTRLRALGWEPQIPIDETLAATLNFWRREAGMEPLG